MNEHKQYNLEKNKNSPSSETDFDSGPNILRTEKDVNIKNKFIANDTEVVIKMGQKFKRTAFSTVVSGSVYSMTTTDYLLGVTNLSYAPTIGLPRPKLVGEGKTFIIKDEAGGAGTTTITITSAGEETIDGSSSATILTNYASKSFYTDGANWFTK